MTNLHYSLTLRASNSSQNKCIAASLKAMDSSHWRRTLLWRQIQEPKLRASWTIASIAFSAESIVCQPTTSSLNYKQSVNVGEVSAHRYFPLYWWLRRDYDGVIWKTRNFLIDVITQQQQIACSHCATDDTVTGHNVAHSPAPSLWKITSTTDVNSGAQHHYSYRPHLITDQSSKRRTKTQTLHLNSNQILFIYIQVSQHVSADVGHPQVNTTQGSQYLQVTTSVYMEAHSSKTLKH
jgi:hypothetical protein